MRANPHYLIKPETDNHGKTLAAASSIDATRARNKRLMKLFCNTMQSAIGTNHYKKTFTSLIQMI